MAYSILKSEYPGCTFHRINSHCTIVTRQGVSVGFSYSTAIYVSMYGVLFVNPRYYSNTTAHHRTALLQSMNVKGAIEVNVSESITRCLAGDILNYGNVSQYTIQAIAKAWTEDQRSLQELEKALDYETKKSQKLQSKLDKLQSKLQSKGGK